MISGKRFHLRLWPSLESIALHFTEDRVSFSRNSDFHTGSALSLRMLHSHVSNGTCDQGKTR